MHSPTLKNNFRHHAIPFEREIPTGVGKLSCRNMPPDVEPLLREFEGRQHKEVRLLIVARFADANAVHHTFTERQL
jgi:hypothetical protein